MRLGYALRLALGSREDELTRELALERQTVQTLLLEVEGLRARLRSEHEHARRAEQQVLAAISTMGELKREGFAAVPPAPVAEPDPFPQDDPVLDAIRSRAEPGTKLYRELLQYAQRLQRLDHAPEEIAGLILQGGADRLEPDEEPEP